jgi:peptide/nickel transport system substrate-binding protein
MTRGKALPDSSGGWAAHRLSHLLCVALAGALWSLAVQPGNAEPMHGIAMHGAPQLPPAFTHFSNVNPDAPKGGRLTLGQLGSFDSLNPLIIKGVSAVGVREYIYEALMVRGPDEPFTLYSHIAETIDVPPDRRSVTFQLRPEARFSDGHPITPEDVVFSWSLLKEKGQPFHRSYYKNVAAADITGPRSVTFAFDEDNREMPLIMGLMPVLPKHNISPDTFERTGFDPPVGSGPYLVAEVDAGKRVALRRNPNWWARDLPSARGRYNFDEIRYEYFRDTTSMFEAFKTGTLDLREEDSPDRWATGYDFPAATDGRVVKRSFDIGTPAGMSGFALNTRRPLFSDQRVRRALILLFDFEWINRSLYHALYTRTGSYFERSVLSSYGRPAGARERDLLKPFPGAVAPSILDGTWRLPQSDGAGFNRGQARIAVGLLREAGYELRDGRMVEIKSGRPFAFEALARSRGQERLMLSYAETLKKVGIALTIRQVDDAQYWLRLKTFDFDMIQWNWSASLSPGNEQVNRWSSAAADIQGSLNYPGVKNPAADAMMDALLQAESRDDFEAAVRAFDRVLLSGDYVIPTFHLKQQWVATWTTLAIPDTTALTGYSVDTLWHTDAKR